MKKPETKAVQIGVRVEAALLEAIDDEVEAINREQGLSVSRSMVVRSWLLEAAARRSKKK